MDTKLSKNFQNYAWFSVQVDQYYSVVRIYARHHNSLKAVYKAIPSHEDWPKDEEGIDIPESVRKLFITSTSTFNYMGTTGIFSDTPYPELEDLPQNMINFGFYTCFCFQWTLFENFVKDSVLNLALDRLFSNDVSIKLDSIKRRTGKFFEYIDSGAVFGKSPFITVLPIIGWAPKFETCDYNELVKIKDMRNDFVHAIKDRQILEINETGKETIYDRSMWIMRKFAENIDFEVRKLRERT